MNRIVTEAKIAWRLKKDIAPPLATCCGVIATGAVAVHSPATTLQIAGAVLSAIGMIGLIGTVAAYRMFRRLYLDQVFRKLHPLRKKSIGDGGFVLLDANGDVVGWLPKGVGD